MLSDIIDIVESTEPAYGRLWTALHLAAVHDAFQRVPLLLQSQTAERVQRKRKAEHVAMESRKRAKLPESKADARVLVSRVLALVPQTEHALEHEGLYCDPHCRRCHTADWYVGLARTHGPINRRSTDRKRKKPPQYCSGQEARRRVDRRCVQCSLGTRWVISLTEVLSVRCQDGNDEVQDAPPEARVRHLHASAQSGRQRDPDGNGTLRELSNKHVDHDSQPCRTAAGTANERGEGRRATSSSDVSLASGDDCRCADVICRLDLRRTLRAIHKAGVLHRDIRSWNMMEDVYGRVYIADFDRATFDGSKENYSDEKKRLNEFLAGKYVDEARVIGRDDIDS